METHSALFARGTGSWKGVVMIERPRNANNDSQCVVTSARTLALDGKRAIKCQLPYSMLRQYFTTFDGLDVCVYAEFKDEHLELYERASKKEYFLHAVDYPPVTHRKEIHHANL